MRLSFHGAAQTVTGSQHLLEINDKKLLMDCGLYQGRRDESYERNRSFSYDPANVDALVLSHAHIDHCGNIPNLARQGFGGPIYATKATADLAAIMMADSGRIQEADAEFVNKKASRRNDGPVEPLYTEADAERAARLFKGVEYDEVFSPVPGVTARFIEAGHILGSAGIELTLKEKGRTVKFMFSGDIGRMKLPLLRDPVMPKDVDFLLMESTYGDKPHREPGLAFDEFREVVRKTVARGGKLIIPAFAVGRTQELVYHINEMFSNGDVQPFPVFVDSPLAVNASQVFRRHPECFDEETREFVLQAKHPALDFKYLTYVKSVEESKSLNDRREPMAIISASGMAETGRILHHLRNNIEDPRNMICIVSWQAPYTLGRRLADGEKQVSIFGEPYDVKAEVATIGGLSGHAGQDLLVQYAASVKGRVKKVFLVHGEQAQAMALKEKLSELSMTETYYPELHSSVEI